MKKLLSLLYLTFCTALGTYAQQNCNISITAQQQGNNICSLSAQVTAPVPGPNGFSYLWTFGDGTSSTQAAPVHTYATGGYKQVCVTVSGVDSNNATFSCNRCDSIFVSSQGCHASFQYSMSGAAVSFINTSSSGTTPTFSCIWSFGDGSSSTLLNPTHTYTASGLYTVCMRINSPGCTDSICQTIAVTTPTSPCSTIDSIFCGNTRTMVFSGSGSWNMAGTNGSNSCGYATPGKEFIFRFTPVANGIYTLNMQSLVGTGYTDVFRKTSTGQCNNTGWDCLGRHINNPAISLGNLTAGVTYYFLFDAEGTASVSKSITLNCTSASPCVAHFTSASTGTNSFSFTNTSNTQGLTGVTYLWQFGDNTTSTLVNPTHTYASNTPHFVCLLVTGLDSMGMTRSCDFCDSVRSGNPSTGCQANFTYSNTGGAYQFTNTSSTAGGAFNSFWSFGDGGTSTSTSPAHTYTTSGTYTVCLDITRNGCSDSICRTIVVNIATNNTPCNNIDSLGCGTTHNIAFTNTGVWNMSGTNGNNSCGYPTPGQERIFSFTPANTGVYALSMTQTTGAQDYVDVFLKVAGSCNNTGWTCKGDYISSPNINLGTLQAGTTYYLLLDRENYITASQSQTIYKSIRIVCPYVGQMDSLCGYAFLDANANGVKDAGESYASGKAIDIDGSIVYTNASGYYYAARPMGTHTITAVNLGNYRLSLPATGNSYTVTGSNCGLNFGYVYNMATISGRVFIDNNNNCVYDSLDVPLANQQVHIYNSSIHYYAYTNAAGYYSYAVPPGTYTVIAMVANTYPLYNVNPASYLVAATQAGSTYGQKDFCLTNGQTQGTNLKIQLTTNTTVTPGFPAWYKMIVTNIGTTTVGGTVTMTYDAALNYSSSTSPYGAGTHNGTTHTVTFSMAPITPGQVKTFSVNLSAPASGLTLGQNVVETAMVLPPSSITDVAMSNNYDTLQQQVVGSWDPNGKLNFPAGDGTPGTIAATTPKMKYTLMFQNTGTAPAVNIVLLDTLPAILDPTSLELVSSSHAAHVSLIGANVLKVVYDQIMLPDSNTNERASHGYITFNIGLKPGLAPGTKIQNTGHIYFDYNDGIITNTTVNTLATPSGVGTVTNGMEVRFAPNPMTDKATVTVSGISGNYEVEVLDLQGRVLNKYESNGNTCIISRQALSAGIYFIRVKQKQVLLANQRIVIQ